MFWGQKSKFRLKLLAGNPSEGTSMTKDDRISLGIANNLGKR